MMKKRVVLSAWCVAMTAIGLFILVFLLFWAQDIIAKLIVCVALVGLCVSALFYMPLAISVNSSSLSVHTPMRIKSIPLDEISSIKLCPPTMAERRIVGSGGWFGYWGWFKEPSIGKYFAYYGKASDCFLVTLKDGKKYMLGCQDPSEIVEAAQR